MKFIFTFQDVLFINYYSGGGSLPLAPSLPRSRPSGGLARGRLPPPTRRKTLILVKKNNEQTSHTKNKIIYLIKKMNIVDFFHQKNYLL